MSEWQGELSLAQCNKLVTNLKSMLWMKSSFPSLFVDFNVGDIILSNNERNNIKDKISNLESRVDLQLEIYNTLSYLRKKIIVRNCEVDLNDCLSEIAKLNDIMAFYEKILDDSKYKNTKKSSLEFLMNFNVNTTMDGVANESRTIHVISNDKVEDNILKIKTEILKLEQQRDLLNNETKVTVTLPINIVELVGLKQ